METTEVYLGEVAHSGFQHIQHFFVYESTPLLQSFLEKRLP